MAKECQRDPKRMEHTPTPFEKGKLRESEGRKATMLTAVTPQSKQVGLPKEVGQHFKGGSLNDPPLWGSPGDIDPGASYF